ncbi:MAG TPA: HEAT repeat domain-containing protein [Patescibacteria group bacterium]|jgi:HEAT repeat protein|nr:HEAT repeat domain-containing protein [Patescibacteria group bacterium]
MTTPQWLVGNGQIHDLVFWLIGAVGSVFLLLVIIIIVSKAWREYVEEGLRRRRVELEPSFFKYVVGQGPIENYLPRPLARKERVLVEDIFFDLGRIVKGSVRERARDAFEKLGFIEHYLEKLESRRWWTRAEAAEKLGLMGSERATRSLITHMDDQVPEVRVRAARALGTIRTSEALRPLTRALLDPGRWSAIRVAGILIGAGDESVEILLQEFHALPMHAKIAAIDIFGRIRSLKAISLLRELLASPDPDIRARAAFALGSIGDPTSASYLTESLKDKNWAVRAMAAKALGRLKEEESIDALCASLVDPQWWVRANAAEALKNKGTRGVGALLAMLDSKDVYAAQQAVQMLQESGLLDEMISRLASEDGEQRQNALDIMAKLVKLKRTDLLTEMAHTHPESNIRQRLAIILGLRPHPRQTA